MVYRYFQNFQADNEIFLDQNEDKKADDLDEELDITGIDDDEIDSYLMSPAEIQNKTTLWMMVNKEYLKEQELKIKKEKELREEMIKNGIDPDKKKKNYKKKNKSNLQSNGTALEAIEKIVQEKKMSTKINYDVLKSLNMGFGSPKKTEEASDEKVSEISNDLEKTSENIAPSSESFIAKKRTLNLPDPSSKRSKVDKRPNLLPKPSIKKDIVTKADPDQNSLYDSETIVESGPVIETGPVDPYVEVQLVIACKNESCANTRIFYQGVPSPNSRCPACAGDTYQANFVHIPFVWV